MIKYFRDYLLARKDPIKYARKLGVDVGEEVRLINIKPGHGTFGSEPYLIRIGNHVTVSGGVQFLTHDGGVWIFRKEHPDIDVFGRIIIGSNVFIGYGAILLPGVEIGENSIIGAGAVVAKSIPKNSVAAGVPARVIKSAEEYAKSIKSKAVFIRSLGENEKKRYLIDNF